MKLLNTFSQEDHNALLTALCNAAGAEKETDSSEIYDYLESTPKASLVTDLCYELNKLGFKIKK
jgi:hypothetical protein